MSFDWSSGPLGRLLLVASDEGLRAALWNWTTEQAFAKFSRGIQHRHDHPVLLAAKRQFSDYFAGIRKEFSIPLAPLGTSFQKRAWNALLSIPYGKTISYQEQAKILGGENFARAVGAANRTNPISIIIPCHRVIGKNGSLTGFLYGTNAKEFLLSLERRENVGGPWTPAVDPVMR